MALAAAPLAGCCGIASLLCDPPAPKSPPRYTRDTPLDAVDFLVDAIRRDAPGEIYDSLHPELLEREGGISGFQFRSGYERFREEFREDAERFARATREAPRWRDGAAWVFVQEADASVWLVFRNRPRVRAVAPGEEFVVDDAPPLAELFGVEGGALVLRRPVDLGEQAAFLDPRTLSRVEVSQDWRLFAYAEPRNVRFVERLREMKGAER